MKPPWFFCCGWWSPWCFVDEWLHRLGLPLPVDDLGNTAHADWWICRKHDAAVDRHLAVVGFRPSVEPK